MILSNNGLITAQRCLREYHYRYNLGVEPVREDDSEALSFGRAVHTFHETGQVPTDPRARAICVGYVARYTNEPFEIVGREVQYERCRIDALARMTRADYGFAAGDLVVIEHKTSSEDISMGSAYWKRLRLATQVSLYLELTGAVGVIYDVVRRPAQRLKKNETPEEFFERILGDLDESYFVRGGVIRTPEEADAARRDYDDTVALIQIGRYPRNPANCIRYGRECPYFDVCTGAASIDDPSRFKLREIEL